MLTDDVIFKDPLPEDPLQRQAEIGRRIEERIVVIIRRRKLIWRSVIAAVLVLAVVGGWVFYKGATAPERAAASYIAAAEKLRDAGDSGAAIAQLKALLLKEPTHSEARWMLAQMYLASGRGADAAKELKHLRVSASNRRDLANAQIRAQLLARRYLAVECDGTGSCANLTDAELIALRAETKIGLKDFEGAEKILNEAEGVAASLPRTLLVLAKIKLAQWQLDDVDKLLRVVLEQDKAGVEAWLVKGEFELARSHLDAAATAFEAARTLAPTHPEVWIGLARVHLARREFAEAADLLAALPGAAGKSPSALYLKAALAWENGEVSEARAALRELLELRPDYLDALFLKARVSSRAQAYYKAETELLRVLEYSPDDAPARRLLAEVYMALGKPRKAVGVARPLAESGDQGSRFMEVLGEAVKQGQDAETQAWFSDLLEKRKSNAAAAAGRTGAGPDGEIWQLSRCRVLVHFCEQCLFVRGCV